MLLKNDKTNKQAEIEIRPIRRGDGEQFKECISDFYGDGYPYKEYFDEDFITKLCEEGKLYILCAFSQSGEMAGTVGARISDVFHGSVIMCLRVVKKKFRGLGIASIQRAMLLDYLNGRDDIMSVYVDALAHDKYSQQDLVQFGFVTTGIRLQLYKADVMIPYGGYDTDERISQTIMCRPKGNQAAIELFCPKEHEGFVTDIYKRLGLKFKLKVSEAGHDGAYENNASDLYEHYEKQHNSAVLIIRRAGADFPAILKKQQEYIQKYDISSIVCYVNLSALDACKAYEYLKAYGFFFSGIKPLNTDGEYMLMTWLKDGVIKRQLINACEDGDVLIDYIEKMR